MVANTLQPTLPWMAPHTEDRRFRRILLLVLVVCFVIGGIVPRIPVPLLERETTEELPPRLVRIIEDQSVTAVPQPTAPPRAESRQPVAQKPVTAPQAESQKAADTKPPAAKTKPVPTPRQKAAQAGVLAMSDALVELRSISPKTRNLASGSTAAVGDSPRKTQKPSVLAADITRGSAGIDSGVAHQAVLGASGLPGKKASSGPALLSATGSSPGSGSSRAPHPSGLARSQEEIQEILDRNKSAMYAIYNRELRQDPRLQGKLIMSITIAASGRVTRCTIIDSELDAASLEKQLIRLVKRIEFGNKPGIPVVTTKIPIEFFPQ